jgi:hypothetical protein
VKRSAGHALPCVPLPERDELLGAWLLRVADLYGLGLATLLTRINAVPANARTPHWFAANGLSLHLQALAAAVRRPATDLAAMAPPACRPRWPSELGFCPRCLTQAASNGRALTWYRRWMHPLAVVCGAHGIWLTAVATRRLMRVRHTMGLADLVDREHTTDESAPPDIGVDDAKWVQRLCLARGSFNAPWGQTKPLQAAVMVDALAALLLASSADHPDLFDLPTDQDQWRFKSFSLVEDGRQRRTLSLPALLRPRQQVLGMVGHVLRHPPGTRIWPRSWPRSVIRKLVGWAHSPWPPGALAWICPQAAELARKEGELLTLYGCSPRYFRACSALFNSPQ